MKSKLQVNAKVVKWAIIILIPVIILLIPINDVFTWQIRLFSAATFCTILMFAFEVLPNLIPAMILPVFYILANLAPANVVFSPWFGTIPWMFIGGFLFANILIRIGLLKRVAYWIIEKTGKSYYGLLIGIMLSGLAINLLAPGKAILPLAGLTFGICKALNLGKSKESAGIMMAGFFSAYIPLQFIYNPSFAVIPNMAASITNPSISFLDYFIHNIPFVLWIPIVVFTIGRFCKPKDTVYQMEFVSEELKAMGKMTRDEKKGVVISLCLLVYMLTSGLHNLDISWGFLLAGCIMYLPGFNVGTKEDIQKIDFSMIFFTATCLSIGAVANAMGFGKIIADLVLPMMSGTNIFVMIAVIWIICVISNFALTPMAIYATFTLAFTQIGMTLGINPFAVFYTIQAAGAEVIFPYEWALPLFYVSFGLIATKDFMKICGIKMAMSMVFMMVVVVPYWLLIGLV